MLHADLPCHPGADGGIVPGPPGTGGSDRHLVGCDGVVRRARSGRRGGLLVQHFSWSAVFLVNVPLAAAAIVATRLLVGESRDPKPGRFDPLGAVGSMAGVGLLVWTIIEAPAHGWGSAVTVGGLVGSAVLLGAFVLVGRCVGSIRCSTSRCSPMPRFSAASGAIAAAFFGLFGFIFLVTQYFQVVRGYGVLQAGVSTLPFAVVIGTLSPVAIVLMKRFGTTAVVATGLALMSSGFVLAASSDVELGLLGPHCRVDGVDGRRARADHRAGHRRSDHGRAPGRPSRRRIGGQRHHQGDRRDPRGGHCRVR